MNLLATQFENNIHTKRVSVFDVLIVKIRFYNKIKKFQFHDIHRYRFMAIKDKCSPFNVKYNVYLMDDLFLDQIYVLYHFLR